MAQWLRNLKLQPEWDQASEKEITVQQLAGVVAKRLLALSALPDAELNDARDDIAGEFNSLAADPSSDTNDFDEVMERLYDWADTPLDNNWNGRKVCWIDRFSRVNAMKEA